MPLSATNAKMLEEWSARFEELGVEPKALAKALETKPDAVTLDALYETCCKAAKSLNKLTFDSWVIVTLSGNIDWVAETPAINSTRRAAEGVTPAHLMAFSGNVQGTLMLMGMMQFVLEHEDQHGRTIAEFIALSGNYQATLQLLKYSKIDPQRELNSKATLAHCLVNHGKIEDVISFIEKYELNGAQTKNHGWNIAHIRALTGDAKGTIKLIERFNLPKKAVTNQKNNYALLLARNGNAEDTIQLINYLSLEKKQCDNQGYSVAHQMAYFGHGEGLRKILLWAPELLDTKTIDGKTVESIAIEHEIDFLPIRRAVVVQTYPERIKKGEANWQDLLIELKNSGSNAVYLEACRYQLPQLANQWAQRDNVEDCLISLMHLAEAGIEPAQEILKQIQIKIDRIVDDWAERFEALKIKRELLAQALLTKPDECDLETLYQHCRACSSIKIVNLAGLILLSGNMQWVSNTKSLNLKPTADQSISLAHLMAATGNVDGTIAVLKRFDLDKNHQDNEGRTIANWMVESDYIDSAIELIEKTKLDKKLEIIKCGPIAFQTAGKNDVANTLKLIERLGFEKNHVNSFGWNVAHQMARKGSFENVVELIEKLGLDKKALTNLGSSYAMMAARCGRVAETIQLINYSQIAKTDVDKYGNNIAHLIACNSNADNLQAILLWAPELIDTKTNDGKTVESIATANKIEFAPIRQAVQKAIEDAKRATEMAKHAQIIETYPQRILNSEQNWEMMLGELKNSCEIHPDKPLAYANACQYQINRLKRQLSSPDVSENEAALTSLQLLQFCAIPEANKIMSSVHGSVALQQAMKLKDDIKKQRGGLFSRFYTGNLHVQFLQQINLAIANGSTQAYFELGEYYEKFAAVLDIEKAYKTYYEGAKLDDQQCQSYLKETGELQTEAPKAAFLSLLYRGLYLNYRFYLQQAIDFNLDGFVAYIQNPAIALSHAQKIVMLSLAQQKSDVYAKLQMQSIQDELNKSSRPDEKASYIAELKKHLPSDRLNIIALKFADTASNTVDARKAMLAVVDKKLLDSEQLAAFFEHQKALSISEVEMPVVVAPLMEVKPPAAESSEANILPPMVASFLTMLIEDETKKLKLLQHQEQLMVLDWLSKFIPLVELTPAQYAEASQCRALLHNVECNIECYLQSPNLIRPEIPLTEQQRLLVREFIQKKITAVIAAYPIEANEKPVGLATLSSQVGHFQAAPIIYPVAPNNELVHAPAGDPPAQQEGKKEKIASYS